MLFSLLLLTFRTHHGSIFHRKRGNKLIVFVGKPVKHNMILFSADQLLCLFVCMYLCCSSVVVLISCHWLKTADLGSTTDHMWYFHTFIGNRRIFSHHVAEQTSNLSLTYRDNKFDNKNSFDLLPTCTCKYEFYPFVKRDRIQTLFITYLTLSHTWQIGFLQKSRTAGAGVHPGLVSVVWM